MFKIIAWILFFYLIFRLIGYIFAPSRRVENPRKKTTILHQDKQAGTKVTPRDEDGEYIDYKEIK